MSKEIKKYLASHDPETGAIRRELFDLGIERIRKDDVHVVDLVVMLGQSYLNAQDAARGI